jgi:hypothetical protein
MLAMFQWLRERSHWNMANITPKDPVTLGLTSQRELDAAVARAAKLKGIEAAPTDPKLADEREALIVELRAEREAVAREAEAALLAEQQPEVAAGAAQTPEEAGEQLFRR